TRPEPRRVKVVVMTSDRGLAGPFNSNINRRAERWVIDNAGTTDSITLDIVGRKGRDYFKRKKVARGRERSAPGSTPQALEGAREIANHEIGDYLSGKTDAVFLVYNEFKSAISQKVTVEQLLPVAPFHPVDADSLIDFTYEPSPEAVLSDLVPLHVEFQIYR